MAKNLEIILMCSPNPSKVNSYKQKAALAGANFFLDKAGDHSVLMDLGTSLRGKTAVIVDDNEDYRKSLADNFRFEGVNVITFSSASEALEAIPEMETPADVVLSDVNMPGMNGFEFVRQLRAIFPQTP